MNLRLLTPHICAGDRSRIRKRGMGMRIYNRSFETISKARQSRISKTRAWQTHSKVKTGTGGSTRATGTLARNNGVTSKSDSILQQILSKINQNTGLTGETIAENQTKVYDYGIAEVSARRTAGHMERLAADKEESLYGEEEKTRELLEAEIAAFADDYNIMVKKLNGTASVTDETAVKNLKKVFTDHQASFRNLGITVNDNGTITLDPKKLKQADTEEIKKLFGAESSAASKLKSLAKGVEESAKKQAETLRKASYMTSTNYNRNASDNRADISGARYSAKG